MGFSCDSYSKCTGMHLRCKQLHPTPEADFANSFERIVKMWRMETSAIK